MCNQYPNCNHAGVLLNRVANIARHCETTKPNHTCFYLRLGCKGCTFANFAALPVLGVISSELLVNLVKRGLVSGRWAAQTADNLIEHTQRQLIYNCLCTYIEQKDQHR
jgi:hypothetical protein